MHFWKRLTTLKIFQKPIYLFLISFFPAMSLLGNNISGATPDNVIRPILFSLLVTFLLFFISYAFSRDLDLSGAITLVLIILFFSYGHIFTALESFRPFGFKLSRNSLLLILNLGIAVGLILFLVRHRRSIRGANFFINIFAAVLFIFPLLQIVRFSISSRSDMTGAIQNPNGLELSVIPSEVDKPDIYLIVLDGYNRADVLDRDFQFDNSKFISELKDIGFKVNDCSISNYNQSRLVLTSELNLDYMDPFFEGREKLSGATPSRNIFSNNLVRRLLEESGYQTYIYKNSFYPFLQWNEVDHNLSSANPNPFTRQVTEFEMLFLHSTILKVAMQYFPQIERDLQYIEAEDQYASSINTRNLTFYMLRTLPELAKERGPKFVYAHFTTTHPPFTFDTEGKPLLIEGDLHDPEVFIAGYNQQIEFINRQLIPVLKQIIANSKEPPIILLQSDHGMGTNIDMVDYRPNEILAAFYLPGGQDRPELPVSPVNFFRYILNQAFGYNLDTVVDRSYQIDPRDFSLVSVMEKNPACVTEK